ncbi:DUF3800 domain-containing protein [Janthinobacterium kumbetense]|uniref:DUF3800 domain-containing protein n=1 Tax=Janthinobacterium kumbetense TaxID=2950280 RepID=A0ABT0WPA2_9BURK|nr:DUF3800 domain-containing protein [Janthinobacterium kumbetense]MCM2565807.1 DUF3800 domain-containing protein [Janthinobacterium kumbetense]
MTSRQFLLFQAEQEPEPVIETTVAISVQIEVAVEPAVPAVPTPSPLVIPHAEVVEKFSSYIVYVDESGDHGMLKADDNYPMFVLAFCVFHKRYYTDTVVPTLEKFKFKHFGHDLVVLHEHEIRKEKGDFNFFASRDEKVQFLTELTEIIETSNFVLISCAIDKNQLRDKAGVQSHPYHLALGFCLETLYEFLQEKGQEERLTHVVFERRGKKEDNELELEFRRMCDGANKIGRRLPFDIVFADKKVNSSGLQLADLVARPVGMRVLKPLQENRAFSVLKRKFYCSGGRENVGEGFEDWGLKIHPAP